MTARKARPTRSRQLANRFILAFLVLLALAGLYGVAGLSRAVVLTAATPAGPVGKLPVTAALVACPAPGSAGLIGGNIAEASAPASTGSGQVALTALSPAAKSRPPAAVNTSPRPGQLTVRAIRDAAAVPKKLATLPSMVGGRVPTSRARGGLIIAATGSNAPGFDVEQLSPGGLPTARCQAPGSDFWFLGPETTTMHTELYLMNADSTSANAHLSVQTDSGPLLGTPDSGIVIPPHAMIVQSLDKLVHAAKAASFHVTTSTGRVVAAIRESGSSAKPGEWLPAVEQPGTTQMLTGLPATAGTRELYVTVPGSASARVKVTAVTPRGSYQPTGGSGISLLGHLTTGVSIPSLGGNSGSIKISSNVPVTTMLEVSGGPPGAPGAFIGGSDPVTEQGVVAASPVGPAGKTQLVLSAPGAAASVRITLAVAGTALTGQTGKLVKIDAKSAAKVRIGLPKGAGRGVKMVAIVVTPLAGSGPVYAARLAIVGGSLQTVLPVVSSPTRIDLPDVGQSLVRVLGSLAGRSVSDRAGQSSG
ncbi:MAG TPA: DUF5719 family protein [Streptosporangiaceae bacterium]|nr:DUF5719 family protein [Streptosporangiaceae bacterium]